MTFNSNTDMDCGSFKEKKMVPMQLLDLTYIFFLVVITFDIEIFYQNTIVLTASSGKPKEDIKLTSENSKEKKSLVEY